MQDRWVVIHHNHDVELRFTDEASARADYEKIKAAAVIYVTLAKIEDTTVPERLLMLG